MLQATRWSELPAVIKTYQQKIDQGDGVSRLFGYASLITDHKNEKPDGSKDIPNEKARLNGMEVAMNVLAAGEYEFRGTRGRYTDEQGKERPFANVGVYAGLEAAPGSYAEGMNITAGRQDMQASLKAYIKRELGEPPQGISLDDVFDDRAAAKFAALKHRPEDEFGMYKFQVVEVDTDQGKRPAITVSTNEHSKFAAIGHMPMQTAHLILDGQGYRRTVGSGKVGGAALDYFKGSVIGVARKLGLNQPRLEKIGAAVEELAGVYAEADKIIAKKLPTQQEREAFERLIEQHPDVIGVASPRFGSGENVNQRAEVPAQERALTENQMPHTAVEKFMRIARLHAQGQTARTR